MKMATHWMWLMAVSLSLAGCVEPNAPRPSAGSEATEGASQPPPTADDASGAFRQATLCNIEALSGTQFGAGDMPVTGPTEVVGWLAGEDGNVPQQPSLILADATKAEVRTLPLRLAGPRPDVVAAFPGTVGLENSGFKVTLDPAGIAAGRYHLYLTYKAGSARYICDNGRFLRVDG